MYSVQEQSTLQAFADKYSLNIDDLMSLNYLTPPSVEIHVGQELILPLTRSEAKAKGLVGAEEFIPLELEEAPEEAEEIIIDDEEPAPQPKEWSLWIDDSNQQVITPEQTEQHLKSLEEQQAQQIAEMKAREQAQLQSAKEREEQAKKEQELAKIKKQAPSTEPTANNECNANQCLHK